ncbi:alpha/beta hydrolase family protein [Streptomyces sp. NPDC088387]|uniref:alpha/beta hydrolase family protein n=1 Tax=Streptomyces sp. NPDC088387 TaxID=3365859 RepID=UPI00380314B4
MNHRTLQRGSRAFSPNGLRAVCVAQDEIGARHLETWELTETGPRVRLRVGLGRDLPLTQSVALDDGRALLSWHEPGGRQRFELFDPAGGRRALGPSAAPLRLLPGLDLPGWIATAVAYGADGHSTVHRIGGDGPWLAPVARLPGRLGGAAAVGATLAVTAVVDGTPTPLRIDPAAPEGSRTAPLTGDLAGAGAHVLLSRAGRVLLAADTGAGLRLALVTGTAVRLLDIPETEGSTLTPLALDPTGDRLALAVNRGARSELAVYELESGTLRRVTGASGVVGPEAAWTHRGLWSTYSDPARPTSFGWVPAGGNALYAGPDGGAALDAGPEQDALRAGPDGVELDGAAWHAGPDQAAWHPVPDGAAWQPGSAGTARHPAADRTARCPAPYTTAWHPARLERLPGADGLLEAVVHGPDWRGGDGPVVVALHGGPDRHWTLGFDALFQLFAAAGLTVIAPNQRGGTGYGREHADAIRGAWGGPDLADIRSLRAFVEETRGPGAPRPAVYGSSYGAFLALLATAADPDGWSACAAVAPFTSVPALYADAPTPTRNLVDRLAGHGDVADALGPRDLLRLAERIRTRVLLLHGRLDETIPVAHSRALAYRLVDTGHGHVTYREPADRGHMAFSPLAGSPQLQEITDFLTRPDVPPTATASQGHRPLLAAIAH